MANQSQPQPNQNQGTQECVLCHCFHTLPFCRKFLTMSTSKRRKALRNHNMCFNCLAPSHTPARCMVMETCHRCGDLHHTLLHETTAVVLPQRKKRPRRRPLVPQPGGRSRAAKQAAKRKRIRKANRLYVCGFFERDICPGPSRVPYRKRLPARTQARMRAILAAAMMRTMEHI